METYKIAKITTPDVLAYDALDSVLKAHASLDALTSQGPDRLQMKIRHVIESVARSAREIDEIVRSLEYCASAGPDRAVREHGALFAANDVDELVASLPGATVALCGSS